MNLTSEQVELLIQRFQLIALQNRGNADLEDDALEAERHIGRAEIAEIVEQWIKFYSTKAVTPGRIKAEFNDIQWKRSKYDRPVKYAKA